MSWTWRCQSATGELVEPADIPLPPFAAQGDAESWLGETWRELADAGVSAVTLLEDGREVYGPMSLDPPTE